jgi:hypothetical protein
LVLLGVVIAVAAVQVLVTPWAFHMGERISILGRWSGSAVAQGTNGGRYAIQLNLRFRPLGDQACSPSGCSDFQGSAVICTPAGIFTFTNLGGKTGGWWSTNGQPISVDITHGSTPATRYLQASIKGIWRGTGINATDGGYLARDFLPDGTPRVQLPPADPADAVPLTFSLGNFAARCRSVNPAA